MVSTQEEKQQITRFLTKLDKTVNEFVNGSNTRAVINENETLDT